MANRKWTEDEKKAARDRYQQEKDARMATVALARRLDSLPPSSVQFHASVRVSAEELMALTPPQVGAFMHGIAQVLAASKIG
jgi:hypothetical protein